MPGRNEDHQLTLLLDVIENTVIAELYDDRKDTTIERHVFSSRDALASYLDKWTDDQIVLAASPETWAAILRL